MKQLMIKLMLVLFIASFSPYVFAKSSMNVPVDYNTSNKAIPQSVLKQMPIKEIAVFKDGHTFVLHKGTMPTDGNGNVEIDYLPRPVIGTFWPYSADANVTLESVVAGKRRVSVERTALSLRDLMEANVGKRVKVTEKGKKEVYEATIVGFPARSSEELAETSASDIGVALPIKGQIVLLKTADGTKAMPINRIQDVTFIETPKVTLAEEEFRNLMTLRLDWGAEAHKETAQVGLVYLQRGIRWIPSYKVTLDGEGNAVVKLQATIINELADLNNVTANLVIGVPSFAFKETVDPISLQNSVARLSEYFRQDSNFSNAIMTQMMNTPALQSRRTNNIDGTIDLGPQVKGANKSEDMFVFNIDHLSLRKGQRIVMPIAEFSLKYNDVYTLDIPFAPPPELRRNLNSEQRREMARLLAQPKVMHKIRLQNNSEYPLTTAPSLIFLRDRILAQGMMTYTAIGAKGDLKITTAVDIQVKKTDFETTRTAKALRHNHNDYFRVDQRGIITLTNYRSNTVDVEVSRSILGNLDSADNDGKIIKGIMSNRHNWPNWWYYFNSAGKVKWRIKLDAGKNIKLGYGWHYFWR